MTNIWMDGQHKVTMPELLLLLKNYYYYYHDKKGKMKKEGRVAS